MSCITAVTKRDPKTGLPSEVDLPGPLVVNPTGLVWHPPGKRFAERIGKLWADGSVEFEKHYDQVPDGLASTLRPGVWLVAALTPDGKVLAMAASRPPRDGRP
jgi:hypothetical protein